MAQGHNIDGELPDWEEIAEDADWGTLLLGNGMSVNVWDEFAYGSLFGKAASGTRYGGFEPDDRKLFEELGTQNFERVLAELRSAIRISRACGRDPAPFEERYASIQAALGAAVRAVHIARGDVSDAALETIRSELLRFDWIFTTSYDLIAYWAMGFGDSFAGFCDCFWSNGRNEFDPGRADIYLDATPVFFLHGALHLIVEGDGTTRKLRRDARTLLDQFGRPQRNDPDARPLLVTEGSSQSKLVAIDGNPYLQFAMTHFRARDRPLVVFGHSLSEQDQHLVDAVNLHPERAVAVALRPAPPQRIRARKAEMRAKLESEVLYFFDSTSHPLGTAALSQSIERRLTPRTRRRTRKRTTI